MKKHLSTLAVLLVLTGLAPSATCAPDLAPAPSYWASAAGEARKARNATSGIPPVFERERGVSWDGRIGWKTEDRLWVFAAALEGSLKGIVRDGSPFRLSVAVVRVEQETGTFVVEFSILDPSGERVEQVQVEGSGPRDGGMDAVYPAVAGQIVKTFEQSVLK
jgi:hypothetical protein